jgi:hypothetical protein
MKLTSLLAKMFPKKKMNAHEEKENGKLAPSQSEDAYKFYVENIDDYISRIKHDYKNHKKLGVRIIENGVILPSVSSNPHAGGVIDNNRDFVASYEREEGRPTGVYPVSDSEIPHLHETVIYGGHLIDHYGHFITESFSRMWYFLENIDKKYKYVFTAVNSNYIAEFLILFNMLGLHHEDFSIITEPTRFDSIIVPDQANFLYGSYNDKILNVYDKIRDSAKPLNHKKVYLSRSKFERLGFNDVINEEFFENYYKSLGYYIISPESLPIKEQVTILSGAEDVVCLSGTLPHHVLFSKNKTRLTILNRSHDFNKTQLWINQLRDIKCTYIDVSANFLPYIPHNFSCLLFPTIHWKKYVSETTGAQIPNDDIDYLKLCGSYMESWFRMMMALYTNSSSDLEKYKNFTLADIVIGFDKYFYKESLNETQKENLRHLFRMTTGKR